MLHCSADTGPHVFTNETGGSAGAAGKSAGNSGAAGKGAGGRAGGGFASTGGSGGGPTSFGSGGVPMTFASGGSSSGNSSVSPEGGTMNSDSRTPCSKEGTTECVGAQQQARHTCRGGFWEPTPSCAAGENCEQPTGLCATIVPGCAGQSMGYRFCDSSGQVQVCGADLVHADTERCTGTCTGGTCVPMTCGDGQVQAPEECDDGNRNDADACSNKCTVPKCGDGVVQAGEACDDGNRNDADACTNACKAPSCGDGLVQSGEECDDGNTANTDDCSNACKKARCGDGVQQTNEECDDGNGTDNDGCTSACKKPKCGDTIVQQGEACDDGNTVDSDGCTNKCTVPGCGDGITQSSEECDDGNAINTDGCTSACKKPKCGDSFTQTGEECDDGNKTDTDDCSNSCRKARCGDGTKQSGEECDDGNTVDLDGCSNACKAGKCGDNVKQNNEECDDGNRVDTDDCTNACKRGVCGDRIVKPSTEECDDGNSVNTDDCNQCKQSKCGDGIVQPMLSNGKTEQCDDGKVTATCSNKCTRPKALSEYQSSCKTDANVRDTACVAAARRYCNDLGGFKGGIIQEFTSKVFGVGCLSDGVSTNVQFSAIKSTTCGAAGDAESAGCMTAVHDWCQSNKGMPFGYAQEINTSDASNPVYTVLCAPGKALTVSLDKLAAKVDGNCRASNLTTLVSQPCISAAHRYCNDSGYDGGMIQNATDTNKIQITCVDFATYGDVSIAP